MSAVVIQFQPRSALVTPPQDKPRRPRKARAADIPSTPLAKLMVVENLQRKWRPHLSIRERDVVAYVIDNSIAWGRPTLEATLDQMVAGVPGRLATIGISKSTLRRAVEDLKARGLLAVRCTGRFSRFTINLSWSPENAETEAAAPRKEPRAVRQPIAIPHHLRATAQQPISVAPSQHVQAAAQEQKTRPNGPAAALRAVWDEAHGRTFPETVIAAPWGGREFGQVTRAAKTFPAAHGEFSDFLVWCVEHWSEVVVERFGWMRTSPPPEYPKLGFIVRFIDKFVEAYSSRLTERWMLEQGGKADYARLRLSGKTHDEALIAIGEKRATARDREQRAREKAEAQRLLNAAAIAQADAEKARLAIPATAAHRPSPKIVIAADAPVLDFEGGTEFGAWEEEAL
ncbi:hypothetical protein [Azospirillum argentinense]|uniref:hypothetical protein n=1 Tax=Azospirillum argentinense TaxID=2970906 RepID=UPI0032E0210D